MLAAGARGGRGAAGSRSEARARPEPRRPARVVRRVRRNCRNGGSVSTTEIDFTGRVVVITGAGGGIGKAHAELMGARGASVVVNDVGRDVHGEGAAGSAAETVGAAIRAARGSALASADSIATPEGGDALVRAAVDAFGRVDAVVHNAGILRDRSIAKLSPEDVEE